MRIIIDTEDLLKEIKALMDDIEPDGFYYVDKLVRDGQCSLVLHILYDTNEADYFPELEKE